MDLGLTGKVALITGAANGIGFETARILAEEGVTLVLSDLEIDALERDACALKGDPLCVAADVTDPAALDALVKTATDRFGQLDIVVHTAGVTGAKGHPLELKDEDYDTCWTINFMSSVRLARSAMPELRRNNWGRFICISSENAVQPYWEEAVYNASKAALSAFIKNLSYDEAAHGVLCNTVSPAFVESPMTDGMMEKRAEELGVSVEEAIESFLEEERPGIVQKRRGKAQEVASTIAFLVSERASYINGSNVRVDGGAVLSVQN
ncbi:SDR family NAD(P)-dependent oxidoreductase [Larsenimonas suaedae]|uniref:SDR family oxidoreductase n=1 Tax=Larsenimonas suaedae TaxID=1851019 RepID=A0ABU1GXI2_9GAMM|nr:SDR family oxidoreductase [Larsenimonas suaedae]MCM2971504.1 SDR family oxidoreductase [Larsenimonas suaedae]MDR5896760.1 SDR family oxidoreductase [Larsenimonas suaedae]